jgi:hypoxanthine-guanine phosphoribosyltransferase
MPVVRGKNIEPLFTAAQIAERNHAIAKEIAQGPTKDLLVIAILKGSFIFAADLIRALHDTGLHPRSSSSRCRATAPARSRRGCASSRISTAT